MSIPRTPEPSQNSNAPAPNKNEEQPAKPRYNEPLIPKQEDFLHSDFYRADRGSQEERVAKFMNNGIDLLANFVKRTVGTNYEAKNNFSFTQKQKILGYMYFKNNQDLQKSRMFTYLDVKPGTTRDSIQTRIDHLKEMKDYNRAFYIYNLAKCQNRLRTNGYIWGAVISCIVWNTALRNSTITRKLAASAFLIHMAGQVASYRSMDRVFDGIYPIFFKDFNEHLQKEIKEGEDPLFSDSFKDHEITEMMKERAYNPERAMKKIEERNLYNEDI